MVQTQDVIRKRLYRKNDESGKLIPIDPENLQHLLVLFYNDTDEKNFEIITGLSAVIDYLTVNLFRIDLNKSFVLTEDTTLAQYILMKKFVANLIEKRLVNDEQYEIMKTILEEASFTEQISE